MDAGQSHERKPIPEEILGSKVLLRRWRVDDAPVLYQIIENSRERLGAWMFWIDDHRSVRDTEEFLARSVWNWQNRIDLGMAIVERASGRVVGSSGFHNINWKVPSLETGYWIGDGDEGKGYVTEAVKLQITFAFEELDVQRMAITCDPKNIRSRAIPERLGFTLEGQLRNHMRTNSGRLRDTLVYSMTPEDFARYGKNPVQN